MKPIAVQFPQPLTIAVSELARVSARHGVMAYATSLVLAALSLAGSFFYRDITHTFGREMAGIRAMTLWEGAFLVAAIAWLVAVALGLMCLPQKGRARTFGVYSIAINLAAATLAACTLI